MNKGTTFNIYCINTSDKCAFLIESVTSEKLARKLFQLYNRTWSLDYAKKKGIKLNEENVNLSCIRYCYSNEDGLSYDQCNKQYLKQLREV